MKLFWIIVSVIIILIAISFCISVQQEQQPQKQKNSVTIGFAGDIMLGRLVNEVITTKGYIYPWGNMLNIVRSTDLNIINLETTLTTSEKMVQKVFNFKADPDRVEVLKKARIDVVNLANNHIFDFADEGLQETVHTLDKAGVKHVGAGTNITEAKKPVMIEKNGIKIGIVGFTDNEPNWIAQQNKPGTNYVKVGDIHTIKKNIALVRDQVDILILSIHWGPNMQEQPSTDFIEFAHAMIDSGVDIIHGHSAHIPQGIELYKNKLIMYDTGDFIDDYAVDAELRNDLSFFFQVIVEKNGIKNIQLIPVQIKNMQVNLATGKDRHYITEKMIQLSQKFGTQVQDTQDKLTIGVQE